MTSCPAVLVAQYNITQQKELELKLSVSEAALQRCACVQCVYMFSVAGMHVTVFCLKTA